MNDTLTAPEHLDRFLDYVFWQHNNHLGMWLTRDERYEQALSGLAQYQMRAGYRYVLERVTYGAQDGRMEVCFDVRNIGASPFYYRWPVVVALLDDAGHAVYQGQFDADIRSWMPGDRWNFERRAYEEPAKTVTVSGSFDVSAVPAGVYTLALAILDPGCGRPNVLFATRQYRKGGWHPMGRIGIGVPVSDPILPPDSFDDQRTDDTLRY